MMYKHCITFQRKEAVDALLKDGYYEFIPSRFHKPTRQDKTEFYQKVLNTAKLPIYAFYTMYCCTNKTPIDVKTVGQMWANLMGYYRLENHYIIEMDIPKEKAVVGIIDDKSLWSGNIADKELEVVFTRISLENVKMIAKPLTKDEGYERVVYHPIYLKSENVIFSEDIGFSGDGYGDNYAKFGWTEPEEGYTFSQLKRMMSQRAWDDFMQIVIPRNYSSQEKADYYKLIKNVKYVRR